MTNTAQSSVEKSQMAEPFVADSAEALSNTAPRQLLTTYPTPGPDEILNVQKSRKQIEKQPESTSHDQQAQHR